MSKTDGILDVMGWRLDTRPRPQLYVGPSRDFVTEQFEPRLMKLFEEAPRLATLLARGQKNKKVRKQVNGVPIRLAWAGSETSLASDQAGDVYIDEYDKMFGGRLGTGDAFTLAKARADTYADRKICVTSTPKRGRIETEKCEKTGLEFWKVAPSAHVESPIWLKWQAGTRHHWAWRCPHCSEWFIPRIRNLKASDIATVDPETGETVMRPPTPAEARRSTYLLCPVSGCIIDETLKSEMNAAGDFVAPGQTFSCDGGFEGDPPDSSTYSLWVSGAASPFLTWGERVEEIMNARLTGDPEAIQGAVNKVGELYASVPAGAATVAVVMAQKQPYKMGEVPREVVQIHAGIDVQKRELYYTIRGFGSRGSSWLLDAGRLFGHTGGEDVWADLATLLTEPIGGMRINSALIDSGFRPDKIDAGDVHKVYDFCRRYPWIIRPTKGVATRTSPVTVKPHEVRPDGKTAPFSVELVTVDTDFFKSLVTSRLVTAPGTPGALGMPSNLSEEYARHLVSEARVITNGKPVWETISDANHWLDCEALCAVAGYLSGVQRIPEGVVRDWDDSEPLSLIERLKAPPPPEVVVPVDEPGAPPSLYPQTSARAPVQVVAAPPRNLRDALEARAAARAAGFNQR